MLNHKKARPSAYQNLTMLKFTARILAELKEEVVFLGGCTTGLFITDIAAPDVRNTLDIDCLVDVISVRDYHLVEKKLERRGFKKVINDDTCRWHYEKLLRLTLDVLPTRQEILGFGSPWFKAAIKNSISHQISENLIIKTVDVPHFLATKIIAFEERGNHDFLASHDFEDIVTVIDGRAEVVEDIASTYPKLKKHIVKTFADFLADEQFQVSLPGCLNDSKFVDGRVQKVLSRMKAIRNLI
jgi:hypothetical protein